MSMSQLLLMLASREIGSCVTKLITSMLCTALCDHIWPGESVSRSPIRFAKFVRSLLTSPHADPPRNHTHDLCRYYPTLA